MGSKSINCLLYIRSLCYGFGKLELLMKRVKLTINVIEKYKENEVKYLNEIKRLAEENFSLKSELKSLKDSFAKNTLLQKDLEDKIVEIIKYLPDSDDLEHQNNKINL